MSHLFLIAQLVKSKWHIVFPLKIEGNGTLVSFSNPDAKPENHEFWARVASSSRGSFFRDFFRQTAFSITWINELNEGSDKKTRSINVKELFKGLRKSRYEGTNQGTKGTILNETLLLLPRFPHKKRNFREVPRFPYWKKNGKSRYKLRAHF